MFFRVREKKKQSTVNCNTARHTWVEGFQFARCNNPAYRGHMMSPQLWRFVLPSIMYHVTKVNIFAYWFHWLIYTRRNGKATWRVLTSAVFFLFLNLYAANKILCVKIKDRTFLNRIKKYLLKMLLKNEKIR